MTKNVDQSGFTVIELLITLFIAVAFLVSGYQLYSVIIKTSGDTRAQARAADVASDYMKKYEPSTTNPCTEKTPLDDESITVDGLTNVSVSIHITCPYASMTNVSKVQATVTYDTDQKRIDTATFVQSDLVSSIPQTSLNGTSLAWLAVQGATSYRVQFAYNSDFSPVNITDTTSDVSYTFPDCHQMPGPVYGRVQTMFGSYDSEWSATIQKVNLYC